MSNVCVDKLFIELQYQISSIPLHVFHGPKSEKKVTNHVGYVIVSI